MNPNSRKTAKNLELLRSYVIGPYRTLKTLSNKTPTFVRFKVPGEEDFTGSHFSPWNWQSKMPPWVMMTFVWGIWYTVQVAVPTGKMIINQPSNFGVYWWPWKFEASLVGSFFGVASVLWTHWLGNCASIPDTAKHDSEKHIIAWISSHIMWCCVLKNKFTLW